jgi:hypothetical protein
MARLTKKKRKTTGSYERLFGVGKIGELITSIQSGVIRQGNEVAEILQKCYNGDLPIFFGKNANTPKKTLKILTDNPNGIIIFGAYIPKKTKTKGGKQQQQEIDVIVFDGKTIYICELKNGNNLDTKKSTIEINGLENASNYFEELGFITNSSLVLIHMNNGVHEIKDVRASNYVMSGNEFCNKFNFDFAKFSSIEKDDQQHNRDFLKKEITTLLEVL